MLIVNLEKRKRTEDSAYIYTSKDYPLFYVIVHPSETENEVLLPILNEYIFRNYGLKNNEFIVKIDTCD